MVRNVIKSGNNSHISELDQSELPEFTNALISRTGLKEQLGQAHLLTPKQRAHVGISNLSNFSPGKSSPLSAALVSGKVAETTADRSDARIRTLARSPVSTALLSCDVMWRRVSPIARLLIFLPPIFRHTLSTELWLVHFLSRKIFSQSECFSWYFQPIPQKKAGLYFFTGIRVKRVFTSGI